MDSVCLILLVLARTQVHALTSPILMQKQPYSLGTNHFREDGLRSKPRVLSILGGGKEVIAQDGVEVHYQDMVVCR